MPKQLPHSIEALVEQQVRRWRLQQAERKKEEAKARPVIVVSREFGAQGALVGKLAADTLGFSFWDQELVHAIAERSGVSETLVETLDEHARSALDDLLAASLLGDRGTEYAYVRELHRVVHTIQRHGGAVIIGRGAQFILKPNECLRVRVIGPLSDRVAGYAAREKIPPAEAEAKVRAVEKDRRTFMRQTFAADVADPSHYDITLNMAALSVEGAASVIVAAYRARFGNLA
jgi:cytidylate kinase-like protein